MISVGLPFRMLALGAVLASIGLSAHAGVVTYVGTQGPKADLTVTAPPALTAVITDARTAFEGKSTELGRNEFEALDANGKLSQAGTLDFAYTGGSATVSGSTMPTLKDGSLPGVSQLGRYNMTPGVVDPFGTVTPGYGHWLEASQSFQIDFSSGVSALSFFVTDLGDYDGSLTIELYDGNGVKILSQQLTNSEGQSTRGDGSVNRDTANGNLLYFGVTSSDIDFISARFIISQGTNQPNTDWIGFDSFVVGQFNGPAGGTVPEPASLALVGMALAGAGFARRRTAAR